MIPTTFYKKKAFAVKTGLFAMQGYRMVLLGHGCLEVVQDMTKREVLINRRHISLSIVSHLVTSY